MVAQAPAAKYSALCIEDFPSAQGHTLLRVIPSAAERGDGRDWQVEGATYLLISNDVYAVKLIPIASSSR